MSLGLLGVHWLVMFEVLHCCSFDKKQCRHVFPLRVVNIARPPGYHDPRTVSEPMAAGAFIPLTNQLSQNAASSHLPSTQKQNSQQEIGHFQWGILVSVLFWVRFDGNTDCTQLLMTVTVCVQLTLRKAILEVLVQPRSQTLRPWKACQLFRTDKGMTTPLCLRRRGSHSVSNY